MKEADRRLEKLEKAVGIGIQRCVNINEIEFDEEDIEYMRSQVMLHNEQVREEPKAYGPPGADADLKQIGFFWLRVYGQCKVDSILKEHYDKIRVDSKA